MKKEGGLIVNDVVCYLSKNWFEHLWNNMQWSPSKSTYSHVCTKQFLTLFS